MNKKLRVQKSHPYRVGGLFRHLGQIQNFLKMPFGPFGLLFKLSECVMPRPARNTEAVGQVSHQQGVTACLKPYL